ncbi:MAG: hypothetical protein CVU91_04195 [Firmicutes bacterium HGW-Firmicutes-16]|nr:MAG: hypothetical protein CVU91_04195 [Firmicutes bacterium HGW-Firmicutes-16]
MSDDAKEEVFYRITWARTYLKKYGIIHSEKRTVWSISKDYTSTSSEELKEIIKAKKVKESRRSFDLRL